MATRPPLIALLEGFAATCSTSGAASQSIWGCFLLSNNETATAKNVCTTGAPAADTSAGAPKKRRWGKGRPYYGRVVAVEGLCTITSADDKDTVRVDVDLGDSGLRYAPGDALGILPANCPQVPQPLPGCTTAAVPVHRGRTSGAIMEEHLALRQEQLADAHAVSTF